MRSAVLGVLAGLLAVLAPTVPLVSAPAAAGSTAYICTGYSGCANNGYSHAGYASRSGKMYWRMYSGHNCTNYVAYRMIQAGMSTERPWSGSGNAYNWGLAMRHITDQRPAVGAVAWWNKNVPGAGSVGHVAYVEKVVSPTVIIVSQDSWGGDFSWKRIDKGDWGWPSGFIHFKDKNTLENVARPVLPTAVQVGKPIRLRVGTWKPGGNKYKFQWLANGRPIPNATSFRYTPVPNQRGKVLTARVTATRSGFTAVSAVSNATAPVAPGTLTDNQPPAIAGDPLLNQTLRVTPGSYAPQATTAYAWLADGVEIRDETGPTLTLTRGLLGKTITVRELATARGYRTSQVVSAPLGPVMQGTIAVDDPVVGAGDLRRGATLTVDPGTSRPGTTNLRFRWLRDGATIPGATEPTYRLTDADVGRRITARVGRSRDNWLPTGTDYTFEGLVRTGASLRVNPLGRVRSAVIGVKVFAPGVAVPDGRVAFTIGAHRDVVRLVNGAARIVVPALKPGRRQVTVRYEGTDVIEARTWRGTVQVTR